MTGRKSLLAALALVAPATLGTAHAATTPAKVAVIVMENRSWNLVDGQSAAPYINSTVRAAGISIDPSPTNCNYPSYIGAGTDGTVACTAGYFQDQTDSSGFLMAASGPEYAYLAMGVNANIGDGNFPNASKPGFIVGYPAAPDTSDPASNLFKDMESNAIPFSVWAEDYKGTNTSCDVNRYSESGKLHDYYARRHNPLLLIWDQTPDAAVVPGQTPSSPPPESVCETHMRDFPNNTPGTSIAEVTNFSGSETFGAVDFIIPSLCHDMHNPTSKCGSAGGTEGGDTWLANNLPGIREDVGANGVVVITWDENGPGVHRATGNGFSPPIPTYILPGTDSTGTPGTLAACGTPPCVDNSHFYNHVSTLKALLEVLGTSCTALDDTFVPAGQTQTAQAQCAAATALPIDLN